MLDDVVSIPSFILLCHCTYLYVVPSTEIPLMLTLASLSRAQRCLRGVYAVNMLFKQGRRGKFVWVSFGVRKEGRMMW